MGVKELFVQISVSRLTFKQERAVWAFIEGGRAQHAPSFERKKRNKENHIEPIHLLKKEGRKKGELKRNFSRIRQTHGSPLHCRTVYLGPRGAFVRPL